MSINELFVETPKEKIESFIKSLHPFEEDFYRQCKLANPNGIYVWQTNRSMSRY